MKLGLCLSGGGIKGAAHIGAIRALEEENIKFNYLAGTSSGSIVATLYASGFSTKEMFEIFKKYSKEINYFDRKNIIKFIRLLISGNAKNIDGLNSGEKIRKLINETCSQKGVTNIKHIKKPLLIPAVNICNEELCVFSNNIKQARNDDVRYINDVEIGVAVQASCSFPGVFSPCKYDNILLVDGGIAENIPWIETKRAGANKVLSIVFVDEKPKECCKNMYEIINKSFSILCHELAKHEWNGTDCLLKIKLEKTGLLDKSKINYLYNEGYIQTKKQINDIKRYII